MQNLITEHLGIWTQAIETKSAAGRGSSNKFNLLGIKKLRELILDMAVRGLLVPQDSNDESASLMLEKVATEKAQLIKDGKIKKTKPLPAITDEEKPFELPDRWEWIRLADAGYNLGQKTPDSEFSYIDVGAINKEKGIIEAPIILSPEDAPSRARKVVAVGTVIYSTVRPYLLNIAVVDKQLSPEPIASTAFAIIHPFSDLLAGYIYRYLRSSTFINYVESCQTGIAYPAINDKQFFNGVMPVPPSEEQKRIVEKVDELIALCDQLEQQTLDSIEAHQTLVETLLNDLVNPNNTDNFHQAWSLIAENLDVLFTTEKSIDTLKQTILQLAVMGKLVPQDPNDEPASKLLENIATEKAQLIKDKKIKKTKPQPEITEEEKPFDLPSRWEYVRLSDLGFFSGGKTPSKSNSSYWGPGYFWTTPKDMKTYFILKAEDQVTQLAIDNGLTLYPKGSLLFVVRSGILRRKFPVAINLIECTVNQDIKVLQPFNSYLSNYILLMMRGFEQYILKNLTKTGTTVESIVFEKFKDHPFILPPLEEQKRIISKNDELMALCDQLKTNLQSAKQTQCILAETIISQKVN